MALPTLMIRGKLFSNNAKELEELAEEMPIEYFIRWFGDRATLTGMENRIAIIKSETGSGKSTLFPPELYKAFIRRDKFRRNIMCTQPRILTAIENVHEMIKNNEVLRLGGNIGWSTKDSKIALSTPGIISATVGSLAQELRQKTDEEICDKYLFILIDETHERDVDTDITIAMLKAFMQRRAHNQKCPFVALMSATFDETPFLHYFDLPLSQPGGRNSNNFLWCRGEPAGWDTFYLDRPSTDFMTSVMGRIRQILVEGAGDAPTAGDVLVFLPGQYEIGRLSLLISDLLLEHVAKGGSAFALLVLNGINVRIKSSDYIRTTAPLADQTLLINGKIYTPQRRIILSTNVAETGLTLPNMKYVIDIGFNKETEFQAVLGVGGLITKPAPHSRIMQRRGRAGRKFRGVFYPIYTQETHAATPRFQMPQILTLDITSAMLGIMVDQIRSEGTEIPRLFALPTVSPSDAQEWGVFRLSHLNLVDIPSTDAMDLAIEKLFTLGAIRPTPDGNAIHVTEMGIAMAHMLSGSTELTSESCRAILAANYWGANPIEIITAILSANITFPANLKSPPDWALIYRTALPAINEGARDVIRDDLIDGLVLFYAVSSILSTQPLGRGNVALVEWCIAAKIDPAAVYQFLKLREDTLADLFKMGIGMLNHFAPATPVYRIEMPLLPAAAPDGFIECIRRIKWCFYDGYRTLLVVRAGTGYTTKLRGVPVLAPDLKRPASAFITSSLSITKPQKTPVYNVYPGRISVLDGFVDWDLQFLETGHVE